MIEEASDDKLTTNIKLEYIDIPGLYHYLHPNFKLFFFKLARTNDYQYFNNRAIQSLIDFNYELIKKYIFLVIVVPFLAFHILFVLYNNLVFEHRKNDEFYELTNFIISIVLIGFSVYFLYIEYRQIVNHGLY